MAAPSGFYRVRGNCDETKCTISYDKPIDENLGDSSFGVGLYFDGKVNPIVTLTFTAKDTYSISNIEIGDYYGGTAQILSGNRVRITYTGGGDGDGDFYINVTVAEVPPANLFEVFTRVSNAIREKDGTTAQINASDLPKRIFEIPGNLPGPASKTYTGAAGLQELFNDTADSIRALDGTTADIVANTFLERILAINVADLKLPVPTAPSAPTYTGSAITPTFPGYDSTKMTATGITGTNAGSYTATFSLRRSHYRWADGSKTAKNVSWSIAKAAGSLTLNKTSMTLGTSALSGTITVTRPGNGTISASSSNTSVATVSVSGNIVTVTAKGNGSATITVKVAAGTNYTAPANKTVSVSVQLLPAKKSLENTTWEEISQVSNAGQGENYWSVGDTKTVRINGQIGSISLDKYFYVYILGFNHNSGAEGSGIQFGGFINDKTDQKNCLTDDQYGTSAYFGDYVPFIMSDTHGTSWVNSYIRTSILIDLKNALPADLQTVLKPMIKSTFMGDTAEGAPVVVDTNECLSIPSAREVFGSNDDGIGAGQAQYAYYAAGNSRIQYGYGGTHGGSDNNKAIWYLRDSVLFSDNMFYAVDTDGGMIHVAGNYSYGISPVFMV